MPKSVKVHDDTHLALKEIKSLKRSASIDAVIREMIRATTGNPVEKLLPRRGGPEITSYSRE